ncbi:DNA/RNA polymerases superfamily protein [Tanacetum coccineum]|uniref:DNA/RNA polymerases superfamily protein n=1 Tax=Tanacetum coccineum TaxID=301880 RepID=A0ABQ5G1X1_9ASTR
MVRLSGPFRLWSMLRAFCLEWTGSWDELFVLVQSLPTIIVGCLASSSTFELLYGRKCRALFVGMQVVRPSEGVKRFGTQASSVSIHWSVWILDVLERFPYHWRFLRSYRRSIMSFMYLLEGDTIISHCIASYPFDQFSACDMSLSEEPESILDRQERVMRNKVIPFVKILWKNHPEREATWETEESMRASYPHFFV